MNQPTSESPITECADATLELLTKRIRELGDKANQLLLFLSFALVMAAILETQGHRLGSCQTAFVTIAMRCWVWAIIPIVISVLPLKELRESCTRWYNWVRWFKFVLLWVAILSVFLGTVFFLLGVWSLGLGKW